jgi:hypothetical protein
MLIYIDIMLSYALGEILDNQQMDPTVDNVKERKDMRTV